jgi:diaminopimelate decarboxylase
VKYREGDNTTNIFDLGKNLGTAFKQFCSEYGRELEIWFEPGKYLVSEAGMLIARTNVVKTTPATVFAGVDSGMNHLIRPMMYEAYHDIVNISNPTGINRIYTVVGYICETDTFGMDRKLHEVREGDLLLIKNAGAYGFSMSSNYNSRLRPPEILIAGGKDYLIRKRETLADVTRTMVEVDVDA